MSVIALEGMEFFGYHGVYPEERKNGAFFKVDAEVTADTSLAEKSDNLEDALDYAGVYKITSEVMNQPAFLLEFLAGAIADKIMSTYPDAEACKITVSKLDPPLEGKCKRTWVCVSRARK